MNAKSVETSPKGTKTTITIATTDADYLPFKFEVDGVRQGFTIDVLDYIETHSEFDFEFIVLSWPRALHLVELGKIDLLLSLFKTKERVEKYHLIEPSYGGEISQLFTLTDNNFEFTGQLEQLTPYTVGSTRGYSSGKIFNHAEYITTFPTISEEVLLKLLVGKRIDLAITNPFTFNNLILKQNLVGKVKPIEPYITITPFYLTLSKNIPNSLLIKNRLAELLQQLMTSPEYQKLLDKYQLNY
ncbi:transporter substrate-binding domain-containing protein [Paraglaciecola aquimarina]|uniref:Transporter substrate-binding domain-containing protein n=1 Tax=Paraglaciecola algarum TaxID=3050085 RepID=A0ABS9D4B7_9ALTE|nr:transporter substrate-binding domain-containing protein [Paraglaciecola sp. G1-23]